MLLVSSIATTVVVGGLFALKQLIAKNSHIKKQSRRIHSISTKLSLELFKLEDAYRSRLLMRSSAVDAGRVDFQLSTLRSNRALLELMPKEFEVYAHGNGVLRAEEHILHKMHSLMLRCISDARHHAELEELAQEIKLTMSPMLTNSAV